MSIKKMEPKLPKVRQKKVLSKDAKLQFHDVITVRQQIPIFPTFGWDGQSILSAIESHDQGQFTASEQLFHAMTRHPRIGSALDYRIAQSRNYPFSLEVPEDAPENIKVQTKILKRNFKYLISDFDEAEIKKRTVMFGFCIARQTFSVVDEQIVPIVKPWTHSNCYYHQVERVFYVVTENGEIVPAIGDPWIVFSSGGERPWLNGVIRRLAYPFFQITHASDRWSYFNDVEAAAIKKMKAPALKREQGEVQAAFDAVNRLRSGDSFLAPEGYDLELVTAQGRSGAYKSFLDNINLAHNDIAIALLGNNLTQEIKGGSFAAAAVAESISLDYIKSDVLSYAQGLYNNTMRLWIEKNFHPEFYGQTSLIKYRPKPIWEVAAEEDQRQNSETSLNYANATKIFAESVGMDVFKSLPIDWKEQAKKSGISLIENNPSMIDNK